MYQINLLFEARLQDLERERLQLAQASNLPAFDLNRSLRQGAGEALISLGEWIKPGQSKNFNIRSAGLAGR